MCSTLFFSACSIKTTIKSIQPAQIDDKDIKKVTIIKFKNDSISLSSNIKADMNSVKFNNKKYFTLVNREGNIIDQEQKLQDSGLVNISKDKVFELGEVNSIITGKINSKNYSTSVYYETRTNYNKCNKYQINKNGKQICKEYRKYKVRCKNHKYSINAFVSVIRVSNNDIIYSNNYNKEITIHKCSDHSNSIPSKQSVFNQISKSISTAFVNMLKPTYKYLKINLKEDFDIEYSDLQEKLLENGLRLIELNHIEKANNIFKSLVDTTKSKSVTALYNYAVTNESLGNLDTSDTFYKKAESISFQNKIDEDILDAIIRVEKAIENKEKVNQQFKY